MTAALLTLADWLLSSGGTPVAMARTGDSWKPVCNLREGMVAVLLVKAQPVTAVPGRQTDVNEAAWLAERLPPGLWRASVIPPVAQRERRDLTRDRSTLMQERVTLITRVQKLVEDAPITLAAVASAIMGVSGRALLAARRIGHADPQALAEWAQGRVRSTRAPWTQAVEGRVKPPHRLGLTARCSQIESLDETIARVDTRIQAICGPVAEAVGLRDTSPGVARHPADMRVADIGTERTRVPRADPLASWAGVAPGHDESAGKRASGKTRQGHRC
jgi:transposase